MLNFFSKITLIFIFLAAVTQLFAQPENTSEFQYISPLPDAKYVSPYTTLIIKPGDEQATDIITHKNLITVKGSESGVHSGELILARDMKTIIFKPAQPFAYGETVQVWIVENFAELNNRGTAAFDYQFHITNTSMERNRDSFISLEQEIAGLDALLPDSPADTSWLITVNEKHNPADGYFFLAPFHFPGFHPAYLMIVDNWGNLIYYNEQDYRSFDFKVHPNGKLSYFDGGPGVFYIIDHSFTKLDSFYCKNGYIVDIHELYYLDNENVIMMSYDYQEVDMSQIVNGGKPDAQVIGLVLQEQDMDKNVVFEWRSWDHMQITDASDNLDLTADTIDWVHGNAIEQDYDGHLLISSRHLDEITKINHQTGDIIWRFGGKANMFNLTNDSRWFKHQHDIRLLDDGTYSIFDNSNENEPEYSRGVIYQLDQTNLTASKVWEFNHDQSVYSFAMGSFRKLPNGNFVTGWGTSAEPTITEVDGAGNIELDMSLPDGVMNYRGFKYDFKTTYFVVNEDELDFGFVPLGSDSVTRVFDVYNPGPHTITINEIFTTSNDFSVFAPDSFTLAPGNSQQVTVSFKPTNSKEYKENLLVRMNEGNRIIAHDVLLRAASIVGVNDGNEMPAEFTLSQNYPNPFNPSTVISFSIPEQSKVKLTVFNMLGETVAVIADKTLDAGNYNYRFNAVDLPSGIYLYRLNAGSFSETKKMMLLR